MKFSDQILAIDSPIAILIAGFPWNASSLGNMEEWDWFLKAAIDNILRSPDPKFLLCGKDRIFIHNDAYLAILDDNATYLGKPYPEVRAEVWDELRGLVEKVYQGKTFYFENHLFNLRSGEGFEARYFTFTFYPLASSKGDILGLLCNAVETTTTITANRALFMVESEQREMLETMDIAYFAIDADWLITSVNELMELKTKRSRLELIGKNLLEVFFDTEETKGTQSWKNYHDVMKLREPREFEDYYSSLDIWTRISASPKSNGGMSVVFRDIGAEKKREEELIRAKEDAEKANELKSSFLANMSHEIRTPLGAMMGFASLLSEQGLSGAERASYVDILTRNGEQLGRVINDILDLSKVETGHVELEFMIVSPLQVAHEVVSLMGVLAKEKGIPLSFEDDGTTPKTVVTDPTRMRQVLLNLVGNSLKFTKVGYIKIKLSGHERAGETCCAFEIEDTGAGVAPENIERLFRIFSQADNSMTRKYGGTGLGLALSRALARKLGGDVKLLKTRQDRGSIFRFSIESKESERSKLEAKVLTKENLEDSVLSENALEGLRILLVEDSPDNQQLIWRYLAKFGAQIEIADNGLEGVRMAMSSHHDVILMDIQMPVMDGYTAISKLRDKGYQKPIIALTAHAMSDVRKKCQDIGCTDHLPKPIDPVALVRAIINATVSKKLK